MDNETRAKIELNHALASALQVLIAFEDRPAYFGPAPTLDEQFTQLARDYQVNRTALVLEYERVTGLGLS